MAISKKNKLRPNVCMLVYNAKGQLFLGERYNRKGHWQFPQGGVEPGRSRRDTVIRELREEIGAPKRALGKIVKLKATHAYLWNKIPGYARGKWVGQQQTFWLVKFTGSDRDINLATSSDQEFRSWRWCSVTTVRRIAAKERLSGYKAALEEFVDLKRRDEL
jgi:putative (di)nucleoside polyphosphate hydrolase